MPRAKRSIKSAVTIDGFSLIWYLHRDQQGGNGEEWRGVAIRARDTEGAHRELHLEYPAVVSQRNLALRAISPQPAILAAKVEAHIRQAMEAGWDPGSRGKPYVYEVEDAPG